MMKIQIILILFILFVNCSYYTSGYNFPTYIAEEDRDLLKQEDCIAVMWNDQLMQKIVKAVSVKEVSDGKLRVLPKNGNIIYCDDFFPLGDTSVCQ